MRYQQYKFKFYLNASHAIYIDGKLGERHSHTWEIVLNTLKVREGFIQFSKLECRIEEFINQYQESYLNDKEPFNLLNPTLENCCEYFKDNLSKILNAKGWVLLMIEMSETPTRSYAINLLDEESSESKQEIESLTDTIIGNVLKSLNE